MLRVILQPFEESDGSGFKTGRYGRMGRIRPESSRRIFGLSMQNQNAKRRGALCFSLADAMNGPGSGAADAEVLSPGCSKLGFPMPQMPLRFDTMQPQFWQNCAVRYVHFMKAAIAV